MDGVAYDGRLDRRTTSLMRKVAAYNCPHPLISRYRLMTAAVIACGLTSSTETPACRMPSSASSRPERSAPLDARRTSAHDDHAHTHNNDGAHR